MNHFAKNKENSNSKQDQFFKLMPSVHRQVVKMGKNFQVVSVFCEIILHVNNFKVGDPFSERSRRLGVP
jgi:hypothetical protein